MRVDESGMCTRPQLSGTWVDSAFCGLKKNKLYLYRCCETIGLRIFLDVVDGQMIHVKERVHLFEAGFSNPDKLRSKSHFLWLELGALGYLHWYISEFPR
jgi:hypothetical protein